MRFCDDHVRAHFSHWEAALKIAIFTDYDGTITAEDTIDLMLDTFGAADWLTISKKLDAAGATNLERMAAEFADFAGSIAQVEDLVREKIHIDETFKDFMAYARERGWSLVVLSQGVSQSVETIFAKYGIEGVEWHANALVEADGRTSLSFPEAALHPGRRVQRVLRRVQVRPHPQGKA